MWIRFKFVKLPDFCYGCGRLGHTLKDCEIVVAKDDDPDLCNAETGLSEEKRLFMALQTKKTDRMARKKLAFNNPALDDKSMKVDSLTEGGSTGMETDETMLVLVDLLYFGQNLLSLLCAPIHLITLKPLLNGKTRPRQRDQGRDRIFRLENMWATNPSCADVIMSGWTCSSMDDALDNFLLKTEGYLTHYQRHEERRRSVMVAKSSLRLLEVITLKPTSPQVQTVAELIDVEHGA
ncbi:hypothetical protein Cgig2_018506 [Carnegiea gigantea]|uniref:CCHC-type domain-containing protein n=1 Tax=Carnegiea gigantea TaxID=171969 RepID=A0A9Q1JIX6_9CARY|nr:hypothetical protein Cgig2_018506 [Carnegiea gigantea]